MTDLISRAALFNACANLYDKGKIFAAIQNAPTVDAVEVVRCGECKYRYSGDTVFNVTTGEAKKLCQKLPYGTPTENLDFFCAYGERRADDDDL